MSQVLSYEHAPAGQTDVLDGFVCELRDESFDVAWVHLAGELDIASAARLEGMLRRAQLRARLVVLDLRDLTFMDSRGVRVIVYANLRARRAGRRLVLLRGPSQIQRLFALSGASELLQIVDLAPGEPAVQVLLQLAHDDPAA
ncbi:MAG TPA: STAS domain-containing protein [Solirubrobacteraceae bacterium]